MMGLRINIRKFGPRWIIECGSDRVETYEIGRGLKTWYAKYGEKYGVDPEPREITMYWPLEEKNHE